MEKELGRATFRGEHGTGEKEPELDVEDVRQALDDFGPKIVKLAVKVWKTRLTLSSRSLSVTSPPRR